MALINFFITVGCVRCTGKNRSGDKGQECGCGVGASGCSKCGVCKKCAANSTAVVTSGHNYASNKCMICTSCGVCTGYGANCCECATLLLAPQCQLAATKLTSTRSARFAHIATFAPATELVVVSAVERIALATKVGSVGVGWEPVAPSVGYARVAAIWAEWLLPSQLLWCPLPLMRTRVRGPDLELQMSWKLWQQLQLLWCPHPLDLLRQHI
jgi:hypothetical protein